MPVLSKEFLEIQATIECGFTMKRIRGMKITYSQSKKFRKLKSSEKRSLHKNEVLHKGLLQ